MLLLASVRVSAGERPRNRSWPLPARLGGGLAGAAAMVAIAIPLSSAASLHESQAQARAGDLAAALGKAADARRAEPFAAAPRVQEALILEQQGRLAGAEGAALAAVDREAHQWRAWVILSRIQAERGRARAALRSYRRARALNPTSPLFEH
jgi:tetratricopeptide (TPR) repeat protein